MRIIKNLFFASLVLAGFGLFANSCGDSDGISAETKISGPLGKFFEVVDSKYKITQEDGLVKVQRISIQIKRIAEGGPKEADWGSEPTFNIDIMDADGSVLGSDKSDYIMDKEQLEAIFALGMGETATLTFSFTGNEMKGAAKLKVSSKWKEDKERSSDSSVTGEVVGVDDSSTTSSSTLSDDSGSGDDSNASSSSAGGSTDWDDVLAEYERYVDKYIALARKAKNGDTEALSEYTEYMQEAQELSTKLSNAKGELSPSQVARWNKITLKMSKAAM